MMKFFAYIRVSTAKQGEHGVSLQEQRDAISRYAQRNHLEISAWFEERETAAKRGRPVFNQMLKLLKQGKSDGVIIHKIDRSARNLKDWADLGELIDQGIEVHFANESLDLHSRGGRLSADIQAVVAADYIRNLREETIKGFYGRVKQGMSPFPAPLGYLNQGRGKLKVPDPARAPFVTKAFELYASGRYNRERLAGELYRLGLRNRNGKRVTPTGVFKILHNPYYLGLIKIRRTGEIFPGAHQPLVRKTLFDRVQRLLKAKTCAGPYKHPFIFRRLLTCRRCRYSFVPSKHKGRIYYRCQTKGCTRNCLREEVIERQVATTLGRLQLSDPEKAYLKGKVASLKEDWGKKQKAQAHALSLRINQSQDRLGRLTDAFIDRLIDKQLFEERKAMLLMERKDLEEKLEQLNHANRDLPDRLAEFLNFVGNAYSLYAVALPEEKRDLVALITSNRQVDGKNVDLTLAEPFNEVANRFQNTRTSQGEENLPDAVASNSGVVAKKPDFARPGSPNPTLTTLQNARTSPYRTIARTWDSLLDKLIEWMTLHPGMSFEATFGPHVDGGSERRDDKGWQLAA